MGIVTARGAITVNENTSKEIIENTKLLLNELILKNSINIEDVVSMLFSATQDLDKEYPAKAAREIGFTQCGLMCFQEMDVVGSLQKCLRVLIIFNSNKSQAEIKHVYLKEAKNLRPDLNI